MKKSKSDVSSGAPTFCELSIWKFYQWAAIVFPIVLMVSHWGIFYVFSLNTQEVLHYPEANEICIAWIYTFLFMEKNWLTKEETSKELGISTSTFDRMILNGLPSKGKKIIHQRKLFWKHDEVEQLKHLSLLNARH